MVEKGSKERGRDGKGLKRNKKGRKAENEGFGRGGVERAGGKAAKGGGKPGTGKPAAARSRLRKDCRRKPLNRTKERGKT